MSPPLVLTGMGPVSSVKPVSISFPPSPGAPEAQLFVEHELGRSGGVVQLDDVQVAWLTPAIS